MTSPLISTCSDLADAVARHGYRQPCKVWMRTPSRPTFTDSAQAGAVAGAFHKMGSSTRHLLLLVQRCVLVGGLEVDQETTGVLEGTTADLVLAAPLTGDP
jgi:hypothetical protein